MQVYCIGCTKLCTIPKVLTITRPLSSHKQKGLNSVSRDTQPAIYLEVTVPRIILPAIDEETRSKEIGTMDEEGELVHLYPLDIQDPPRSPQSQKQPYIQGEATTYTSRQGLFRMFRITDLPKQGWAILIQIVRQNDQRKKGTARLQVIEDLTCKIEYQQTTAESPSLPIEVIPGLNRVVIALDEDDTPITYSIDGSES